MSFRMEVAYPDGRPMVIFEERENLDLGSWELVTTYCDPSVSGERWRELEVEAMARWTWHDHRDNVLITRSRSETTSAQ